MNLALSIVGQLRWSGAYERSGCQDRRAYARWCIPAPPDGGWGIFNRRNGEFSTGVDRTREDPFGEVWDAVQQQVQESPGLEAKTLFEWLQREYPGRFSDGQIRTLQRRIKLWRVTEGPAQEVYFGQKHMPGRLCASDFTHMTELGITLAGQTFEHLVYHFVLTYSNWETGTICYSESLESLSEGWQNAVWELGAVAAEHRTDSLSSAVNNVSNLEEFNPRYEGVMRYYGVKPRCRWRRKRVPVWRSRRSQVRGYALARGGRRNREGNGCFLLSGRIVLAFDQRGTVSLAFDLEDDRAFDQAVEESHRQWAIDQVLCPFVEVHVGH